MFMRIFSSIGAFLDREASGPVAFGTAAIVCATMYLIIALARAPEVPLQ